MKKLNELFEIVVNHFKKESPEREYHEAAEVEESELHLSRSGKSRKKPISQHPFRRFWRRYHLTKIVLILGLGFGLVTGGYLFYVAKSTNVNDLQNALKARICNMLSLRQKTVPFIKIVVLTTVVLSWRF